MHNLFQEIPESLPNELFSTLLTTRGFRIERIVSYGHSSPEGFWYDQSEHEWIALLKGQAKLEFEDRILELKPGDTVLIPAGEKHRVAWTSHTEVTVWLAIFYDAERSD